MLYLDFFISALRDLRDSVVKKNVKLFFNFSLSSKSPSVNENDITIKIIGTVIKVHRSLVPDILESNYETCLA